MPKRNDPAVRTGLLYSSIITVKLQKQIGNNTAFPNVQELYVGLHLSIKSLHYWLCYALLLSQAVLFPTVPKS